MSDLPLTDDELLSSALDGELPADDRVLLDARLNDEPDLAERMAALRAAQDLATTPVTPLAPGDADRLVAAALAASGTAGNVTDLAAARGMRNWRKSALAIAASAAVIALAIPAIGSLRGGDDGDFATAGESATADTTSAADLGMNDADAGDGGANLEESQDSAMEAAPVAEVATADPESMPEDDGEAEGTDATGRSLQQPDLFKSTGFDPLTSPAGTYSTVEGLTSSLERTYREYSAPIAPPNEEDEYANRLRAVEILAELDFGHCDSIIDDLDAVDYGGEVIAGDFAVATVADKTFLVGIVQLADETAVLVTVEQVTCTIETTPLP